MASIQIIAPNNTTLNNVQGVSCSKIDEPKAFDRFDINIINLSNPTIWKTKQNTQTTVSVSKDLETLKQLGIDSKNSTIIIVFPRNYTWSFDLNYDKYYGHKALKDSISEMIRIIQSCIPVDCGFDLLFGKNNTSILGEEYSSDFYFIDCDSYSVKSTSLGSKNATTIYVSDNVVLTTLDVCSTPEKLEFFLRGISLLKESNEDSPDWLHDYAFYNDNELKGAIESKKREIEQLNSVVDQLENQLSTNEKWKSILFRSGKELERVVLEILSYIFDYDFSDFDDEKKEDFRIVLSNATIIGEIKGIATNVKKRNISQVDQHCQEYQDYLDDNSLDEKIKGILIINHQRNEDIKSRLPIPDEQINLAQKYNVLIVETEVLLKLFEQCLLGKDKNKIIELLVNNNGLLTLSDIEALT